MRGRRRGGRPASPGYGPGDELSTIRFADGTEQACGGFAVPAVLHQRGDLAAQLGLRFAPPKPLAADAIEIGPTGETSVAGVFAAGDTGVGMPSVAAAIAEGSIAYTAVVRSLL